MGQRQKKKNMLRGVKKLTAENERLNILADNLKAELEYEKSLNSSISVQLNTIRRRMQYLGTMPVYKSIKPTCCGPFSSIETKTIHIESVPYGMACKINEYELENIIKEKEEELAREMAKGILQAGLAQIIIKEGRETGGPLDYSYFPEWEPKTTLGVKLYVIPWEMMQLYGNRVKHIRVQCESENINYAQMCADAKPKVREGLMEEERGEENYG